MNRRDLIALLGGAAVLPLAAHAQQGVPVVGYVRSTTAAGFENLEAALRQGLKETGFVDGHNVAIESHYADNRPDRMSALVADLIRRPVAVLVGNTLSTRVAKAMTATVPLVFGAGTDPIRDGLVASLNHPGGNVTGAVFFGGEVGPKRLELLHQLVPKATTIAALIQPNNITTDFERSEIPAAAQAMRIKLRVVEVSSERDIEPAFATFIQSGAGALFVGSGAFLNSQRERVAALAARHKLPAMYILRDHAVAGGLMSYGGSQSEAYRQVGNYAGRILKGEKPGDLPVVQASKFEFVINLKTAKALGLDIPPNLLALADEVIE